MKRTFIIHTHSVIDLITNSSTEIFVLDGSQTVDAINKILTQFYEDRPWVTCRIWAEEESIMDNYTLMEQTGFYSNEDIVEKINALEKLGFKLTEEQRKWVKAIKDFDNAAMPKRIVISHDRDYFDQELSSFIHETFEIDYHDTDA